DEFTRLGEHGQRVRAPGLQRPRQRPRLADLMRGPGDEDERRVDTLTADPAGVVFDRAPVPGVPRDVARLFGELQRGERVPVVLGVGRVEVAVAVGGPPRRVRPGPTQGDRLDHLSLYRDPSVFEAGPAVDGQCDL